MLVGSGTLGVAGAARQVAENVPNNSVTSIKIVNNAVASVDIKDGTVAAVDLADPVKPRWAHINGGTSNVSIIDGRGALSVVHNFLGRYDVTFNRDVSHCAWTATRTDNATGDVSPGFVGSELGPSNNVVIVRTWFTNGASGDTAEDEGFTVRVDC